MGVTNVVLKSESKRVSQQGRMDSTPFDSSLKLHPKKNLVIGTLPSEKLLLDPKTDGLGINYLFTVIIQQLSNAKYHFWHHRSAITSNMYIYIYISNIFKYSHGKKRTEFPGWYSYIPGFSFWGPCCVENV